MDTSARTFARAATERPPARATRPPARPVPPRRTRWRPQGGPLTGMGFLAPALLLVCMVSAYPIFLTVSYALRETNYFDIGGFAGLDNLTRVLGSDQFLDVIRATALYVLGSLLLTICISLALALCLNAEDRPTRILRSVVLMPWAVSQVVTALLWIWLLSPGYGPVTSVLKDLFGTEPTFLADPTLAMVSVVVANTWMTYPLSTVLLLAAIKTLPDELYEAVEVDGGGLLAKFRHVTLPGIRYTLAITCVMQTVLYLNMVTLVYVMTGGGPLTSTETLSVQIFHQAFEYNDLGAAAVYALVAVIANISFALAYLRVIAGDDQ